MIQLIENEKAETELAKQAELEFKWIIDLYKHHGYTIYLVGGCVRDTLLGLRPKDWDLCTDANMEKSKEILSQHSKVVRFDERGEHFAITIIETAEHPEGIEIAQFRKDGHGRKPEVVTEGVNIEDDIKRRDFTINALFFDTTTCKIIDLVGGISDLENGIIRTVGNPDHRFNEDPLRKLRAIRFATRFGFILDADMMSSLMQDPSLNISRERVWSELEPAYNRSISKQQFTSLLWSTGLISAIFLNEHEPKNQEWIEVYDKYQPRWTIWLALHCTIANLSKLGLDTRTMNGIKLLKNDPDQLAKALPAFWRQRAGCDLNDSDFLIYNILDSTRLKKINHLLTITKDPDLVQRFSSLEGWKLGQAINGWYYDLYLDATECIS